MANLKAGSAVVRSHLEKILASPLFQNSERMSRFLRFVVEETLEGREDQIKEAVIAAEVYQKEHEFDARNDATVRVEASKLRTKLAKYYETEGRDDAVVLSIPKGGYVPVFGSPPQRSANTAWLRRAWVLAVTIVSVLILAVAWFASRPVSRSEAPKLVPLTTYPGAEGAPSLSPDGNQVAFERNGDIFVKEVAGEALVQLTSTPVVEDSPAWSPDGRQIAFVRSGIGIFLISPLGGGERKVAETRTPPTLRTMAWTADSQSLVISELTSAICASLFRVSVTTGEKKRLTSPPEPSIGDGWPAISSDGTTLAFARYTQDTTANVYLVPLAGGEPRRVTEEKAELFGMAWTQDGRELVFASDRTDASRLWRVPATRSAHLSPSPVEGTGEGARFPSISRLGGRTLRLAYQRFTQDFDIRRAEMISGTVLKPSNSFISSTRSEWYPWFSPDGKRIAFVSNRSGTSEIWGCDNDGSKLRRLTSIGGPNIGALRWSPDGARIAFFATTGTEGKFLSYVIGAEGGMPRRLGRDDLEEAKPSWSQDGRSIYFTSGRSGSLQIWKMPADGGRPVQITKGGGAEAWESPDGRLLYYAKVSQEGPGLWTVPTEGGDETRVLDSVWWGYWATVKNGIYFVDFSVGKDEARPVKFFHFQTRQIQQIGTVEKSVDWRSASGFAVSPDGRWLLYSDLASTAADLMLLDHFR